MSRKPEFPIIEGRRFFDFALYELFTLYAHQVLEFCEGLEHPKQVADRVIRRVQYPFYLGKPNDSHQLLAFRDKLRGWKFRRCIEADFWQFSSETAAIGVGDCEDSSILFVACCGSPEIRWKSDRVYEAFGLVRDAGTGRILGGHGWSYCFWDEKWHLIESTLDVPPPSYPAVPDIRKPFKYRTVIYDPWVLFNWERYEELSSEEDPIKRYTRVKRERGESLEKHEAISESWKIKTKPLKQRERSLLARLRWKK